MSAVVFKFPVPLPDHRTGRRTIDVPAGTDLLSVGMQETGMVVWGLVPRPEAPLEPRGLLVVNTGFGLADGDAAAARFLGTTDDQGTVWHVFELATFRVPT